MPTFAIHSLVTRQTPDSDFSHFEGSVDELIELVRENFDQAKPGYRDGVLVVPVPPQHFYSAVTVLEAGDKLVGEYKSRQEGETPRIEMRVERPDWLGKPEAKSVDIILYSHDTLAEDDDAETDADWEIIAINAFPDEETDAPINPITLMHNHFGSDGGTKTNMSPEEFEAALEKSFKYWTNKAMIRIVPSQ